MNGTKGGDQPLVRRINRVKHHLQVMFERAKGKTGFVFKGPHNSTVVFILI